MELELDTFYPHGASDTRDIKITTVDSSMGVSASAIPPLKPVSSHTTARRLQHASAAPAVASSSRVKKNDKDTISVNVNDISVPVPDARPSRPDSATGMQAALEGGNVSEPQDRTREQKHIGLVQLMALCFTLFLAGWNDGTTGPLLPRIQQVYGLNFTIVSLIFVFACVGFLIGALANIPLTDKFGFGKTMVFGSLCQVIGYSIQCSAPPFPLFVVAYVIQGIGLAVQQAQAIGFVATLKHHPDLKMGIFQAAYGLGAFASPLVSTQFSHMRRWSFHFFASLGLAIINTLVLVLVFKFKRQDDCLKESGEVLPERTAAQEEQRLGNTTFKTVMHTRAVHLIAFFILVYVGVEVTLGGWIVTFIIDVRGGGLSAGYISSGFFAGLTVGRVALLGVNKRVGERRVLFIYTALCILLEFVVWFVPSLIGDAIAVAIVGVLLGPMYPIVMAQTSRILPRWILTGSIGWIAGFGQAGSALFPFATGAISQKHGIKSLQPLVVTMMASMIVLWALVPRAPLRAD